MTGTVGEWLVASAWVYVPTGNTGNSGFLRYFYRYKLGSDAEKSLTGNDQDILVEGQWQLCRWVRRIETTEAVRILHHFYVPTSGDSLYFCNAQVGIFDRLPENPAAVSTTATKIYEQIDPQTFLAFAVPTDGNWGS